VGGDIHQRVSGRLVVDAVGVTVGDDRPTRTACVVLGLGASDVKGDREIAWQATASVGARRRRRSPRWWGTRGGRLRLGERPVRRAVAPPATGLLGLRGRP